MSEPNLINRGTLLGFLLGLMLGTGATAGVWVLLRARGEDAANREPPKVEPPAAHVEAERRKLDKSDREDKIRKLEQLAESLRAEIAAAEKQIELLSRANAVNKTEDSANRLAQLEKRIGESESEISRARAEVIKLETERKQLQREIEQPGEPDPATVAQSAAKNPAVVSAKAALDAKKAEIAKVKDTGAKDGDPRLLKSKIELEKLQAGLDTATRLAENDAVKAAREIEAVHRKLRVEKLDFTIKIKKEEQEKLKEECDLLRKLISGSIAGQIDVQAMRDALKPQREMLDKVLTELVRLKMEAKLKD